MNEPAEEDARIILEMKPFELQLTCSDVSFAFQNHLELFQISKVSLQLNANKMSKIGEKKILTTAGPSALLNIQMFSVP